MKTFARRGASASVAAVFWLLSTAAALAHKAMDNHTHCSLDGKGVAVAGATDAQRKAACLKNPDASWDESKALPIEVTTTTSTGSGEKPTARASGTTSASGTK